MLIAAIIVALLIVILALQNAGTVAVYFLFWQAEIPLVIVIICSVLLGVLLVWAILMAKKLRDNKLPEKLEYVVNRAKKMSKRVKKDDGGKKPAFSVKSTDSMQDEDPLQDETPK